MNAEQPSVEGQLPTQEEFDMLRSWEAEASARSDVLAYHLKAVIEIARTWQPHYATKMDRETLDFAEKAASSTNPSYPLKREKLDQSKGKK